MNRVSDYLLSALIDAVAGGLQFISNYANNLLSQDAEQDKHWEISMKLLASFEPLDCCGYTGVVSYSYSFPVSGGK